MDTKQNISNLISYQFCKFTGIYLVTAVTRRLLPFPLHPNDPVLREVVKVTSLNRIMARGCGSYANAIPLQDSVPALAFLMSHQGPLNVLKKKAVFHLFITIQNKS